MLARLWLHFHLAGAYLAQFVKARLEYKADFFCGLLTIGLFHGVSLMFIAVLFTDHGVSLRGWSRDEVLFIYGFSIFPLNLFFCFFSSLYAFANQHIVEGQFDRVLLRPLNSLYQVLLEQVDVDDLFGTIAGLAIVWYASHRLGLDWTLGRVLLAAAMTLCGVAIYAGVFVSLAALSFWWPDRMGFMPPIFNMIAFGKYPVEIYSKLLQAILLWVVPFAFVAFVPATHFLARESFAWYVRLLPVVALVAGAIGATCWTLGVRHYESTGS
jgi:ABC-2 type transport system permease protein